MDATEVNTRWQASMAPYFADATFDLVPEVFHLAEE